MLTGCQKDLPEPEAIIERTSVSTSSSKTVPVFQNGNQEQFLVQYHINHGHLFIGCFIPDISFRNHSKSEKGKIIIFIDGKKKQEVESAAFIIKDLTKGQHTIKLKAIGLNSDFEKTTQFNVNIR